MIPAPIVQHSRISQLVIRASHANTGYKWLKAAIEQLQTVKKAALEKETPYSRGNWIRSVDELSDQLNVKSRMTTTKTWTWTWTAPEGEE